MHKKGLNFPVSNFKTSRTVDVKNGENSEVIIFFLIFSIVIDFLLHYYIKHSTTVLMLKHLSNCL